MSWAESGKSDNIYGHEKIVNKRNGPWHRRGPKTVSSPGTFRSLKSSEPSDEDVLTKEEKAKLVKH